MPISDVGGDDEDDDGVMNESDNENDDNNNNNNIVVEQHLSPVFFSDFFSQYHVYVKLAVIVNVLFGFIRFGAFDTFVVALLVTNAFMFYLLCNVGINKIKQYIVMRTNRSGIGGILRRGPTKSSSSSTFLSIGV